MPQSTDPTEIGTQLSRRRTAAAGALDRMLGFGGIRIEDDILVTEAGHEILTQDVPLPR